MPGQGVFVGEPLASPYKGCKTQVNQGGVYQYYKNLAKNFIEKKYKNCD